MQIFRFHWDCGRMGDIHSIFAVNDAGAAALDALYDKEVYFGEVLGKHSEVSGILERKEITKVDATPDDVATVLRVLGCGFNDRGWATISGLNPLDYAQDDDE